MELVPCGECRRHVDARETACPFCAASIRTRSLRRAPRGRITRAAVFSAALVACESKQPPPQPAPAPQQHGSDDLEKLLDGDHHVADRPPPPVAPADAAMADATAIATAAQDAGVTLDAGMTPDKMLQLKTEKDRRLREKRRKKREEVIQVAPPDPDWRHLAKPYGAPPARRRLV
jgi:hypothetical protein